MRFMLNNFTLLADRSPFRDMASGFRDRREHFDPLDLIPWLLVLGTLFAALGLVSRYLNRRDKRRLYNSPRALFRALCRAHDLDRGTRRLLLQMAKTFDVAQPAELFLDPDRFEAASLTPELARHQEAIDSLRAKLFASESPLNKVAGARATAPPPKPRFVAGNSAAAQAASIVPAPAPQTTQRRSAEAAGDADRGTMAAEEPTENITSSLAERHAVRALETLMQQINASRAMQPASPTAAASTGPKSSGGTVVVAQDPVDTVQLASQ